MYVGQVMLYEYPIFPHPSPPLHNQFLGIPLSALGNKTNMGELLYYIDQNG